MVSSITGGQLIRCAMVRLLHGDAGNLRDLALLCFGQDYDCEVVYRKRKPCYDGDFVTLEC